MQFLPRVIAEFLHIEVIGNIRLNKYLRYN